jgi:hypothetical protein
MIDNQFENDKVIWGIRINHEKDIEYSSCPKWVRSGEKREWTNRGVIIWNETACWVVCLSPQQALDILDDLRESPSWKSEPFSLSWNSYTLPFSEEDRKKWRSFKNRRIRSGEGRLGPRDKFLSPAQTQELLLFLESHYNEVRQLAEEHTKEVKKVLARVYMLILSWRREKKQQTNDPPEKKKVARG